MADFVDRLAEKVGATLSYEELSALAGCTITSQNIWPTKHRLEQRHGLTLVNRVGVGCLVAAMADPPELDRRRGVGRPWRLPDPQR